MEDAGVSPNILRSSAILLESASSLTIFELQIASTSTSLESISPWFLIRILNSLESLGGSLSDLYFDIKRPSAGLNVQVENWYGFVNISTVEEFMLKIIPYVKALAKTNFFFYIFKLKKRSFSGGKKEHYRRSFGS